MDSNPYQAPSLEHIAPPLPVHEEAAKVRQIYLKHEASVKGVGTLYYLGAILIVLLAVVGSASIFLAQSRRFSSETTALAFAIGVLFYLALAALQFFVGWGIRRLRIWARITSIVLSSLGLLASILLFIIPPHVVGLVPFVINLWILLLMATPKGGMVFSDYYKGIISQTPGMKYRTSMVAWIILGIFILLIGGAIVVATLRVSN